MYRSVLSHARSTLVFEADIRLLRAYGTVLVAVTSVWWGVVMLTGVIGTGFEEGTRGPLVGLVSTTTVLFLSFLSGATVPFVVFDGPLPKPSIPGFVLLPPLLALLLVVGVRSVLGPTPVLELSVTVALGWLLFRAGLYGRIGRPLVAVGRLPFPIGVVRLLLWLGFVSVTIGLLISGHGAVWEPLARTITDAVAPLRGPLPIAPSSTLVPFGAAVCIVAGRGVRNVTASLSNPNSRLRRTVDRTVDAIEYAFLLRP